MTKPETTQEVAEGQPALIKNDCDRISRFNLGELLQQDTSNKGDPNEIAAYLIQEHGLGQAIEVATRGVGKASVAGDNYSLSIWREVRVCLRKQL